MKFLLAVLLIAFLFWLPWDSITNFSSVPGIIPDTGGGAAPAPLSNPQYGSAPAGPCDRQYYIQANDTLRQIAARCGISLEALLAANPTIYDPAFIEEGQVITIPSVASGPTTYTVPPTGFIPNTGQGLYVVQEGDTLSTIAAGYNLSLAQLLAANPQISDPNRIYTGQQIILPGR